MIVSAFFELLACLYYLCFLLLTGLTVFIAGQKSPRPHSVLRRTFFLLALSLLLWQATLFVEVRVVLSWLQLRLGRLNFTAIVFAAYFALRFVQAVATRGEATSSLLSRGLLALTLLLALLTGATSLVSVSERIEAGQAITTYGVLFPLYLVHVVGCLVASLVVAFRQRHQAQQKRVRKQLTLIGVGMLATSGIALVTNAFLPYAFGDFRFCDVGALSTVCFVLAVAYATFLHRLFDVKTLIRETLVYGILMAFVLGGYSATVFVVTQVLTDSAGKLTQFAVLFFAFSFDPLRRWLEKKTDGFLFGEKQGKETEGKSARASRAREQTTGNCWHCSFPGGVHRKNRRRAVLKPILSGMRVNFCYCLEKRQLGRNSGNLPCLDAVRRGGCFCCRCLEQSRRAVREGARMEETEEGRDTIFLAAGARYNQPGRIVTLGHFYPQGQVQPAHDLLREQRSEYRPASSALGTMRRNLEWTKLLTALSAERQWPLKHLVELLDPILAPDIALAVVPTHLAYQAFWPVRTLAKQLAEKGREDATSCLVRHTTIRRITFGGASTKALHRQTIRVEDAHLVEGKRVLLLDDVAKSGNSLLACRELLLAAGASVVQAMALGRVIIGSCEPT